MTRRFDIPLSYRSDLVSILKKQRNAADPRKKNFAPTVIDLGHVRLKVARHFGFCYGVENAIEIAYRALTENEAGRVFLLSEMIHNPAVNAELQSRGVRFLLDTDGSTLIPFSELTPEDVVIVPAFGTTVEMFAALRNVGVNPLQYNATCPFVEKVWRRASQLGDRGYSIVIHGKHFHEETRATFSHASQSAPAVIIRDMSEAMKLRPYLLGLNSDVQFRDEFADRFSPGFTASRDLQRIGVVNQTTMLAEETRAIAEMLRHTVREKYGATEIENHFADTRDTLCYATSENQESVRTLLDEGGDLAVVIGGYNSSNTSHLAKLLSARVPTYYIQDSREILSPREIQHLDLNSRTVTRTENWLPVDQKPLDILLTAGASSPDSLVDQVLQRLAELLGVGNALAAEMQNRSANAAVGEGDNQR